MYAGIYCHPEETIGDKVVGAVGAWPIRPHARLLQLQLQRRGAKRPAQITAHTWESAENPHYPASEVEDSGQADIYQYCHV